MTFDLISVPPECFIYAPRVPRTIISTMGVPNFQYRLQPFSSLFCEAKVSHCTSWWFHLYCLAESPGSPVCLPQLRSDMYMATYNISMTARDLDSGPCAHAVSILLPHKLSLQTQERDFQIMMSGP